MKLFTKYNRINLAVMVVLFLTAGCTYYVLISKVLVHEVDEALDKYKDQVKKYVKANDALPVFKNFEEVQVNYELTDHERKKKVSQETLYNISDKKKETFLQMVFTQRVKGEIYKITIAKPLEGTKTLIRTIAYSTLAILLVIITVSILLNYIVLKKLWKPFYTAMAEMQRFKLGSKSDPVLPESDIEEFTLMNQSLAQAIGGAKEDYRILKEFTENASHETQTPLAIIRSKLDLVIQDEGLSEGQTEALKSAYGALSRLSKLNQSLLLLAKIENHQFTAMETISLDKRIEEKIQQFNELWEGQKISLGAELQESSIQANPELIDILLNNLLSNAGRHNVNGGTISILLVPGKLEIANTAKSKGLDTTKLFNRFYKAEQYSKHNGLGLSIVKQIAEVSGMQISYIFHEQQHRFIFQWPV
ncbi:sensor histidine kinase [Pedobacter sp. AW31-3R]|uniref:sensor histidine kinase n=1 Tax=Pedobacter sp. AW31-3R TaxID=3445781 RepID=UPI003FA0A92F